MFEDDLPLKKNKTLTIDQVDLSSISVDELRGYIHDLKSEIERAEKEIDKKKAHADAASAFFKK